MLDLAADMGQDSAQTLAEVFISPVCRGMERQRFAAEDDSMAVVRRSEVKCCAETDCGAPSPALICTTVS